MSVELKGGQIENRNWLSIDTVTESCPNTRSLISHSII